MTNGQTEKVSALSFHGRINRGSFWAMLGLVFLGVILIGILAAILLPKLAPKDSSGAMPIVLLVLMIVVYVIALWVSLATQVKRWHDVDKSGWMALLNIIPLAGLIILIYLGAAEGTPGPNRFGQGPLKVGM